jgi:hypothetical protein
MDGNHLPRRIVVVEVQPQDATPFTPHVGKKAEQMGMGLYQHSHFLSGVVCLWIVRYWQLIHRFSLEIAPTLEHMFHLTPPVSGKGP